MLARVIPPLVVTDNAAGLLARYNVPVSTICVGEFIVNALLPKLRDKVPVEVTVFPEDVLDMVPVPVEVKVTFVPLTTPASEIAELVPESTKLMAPEDVSPPLPMVKVAEVPESVKVMAAGLFVVLERVTAVLESVTQTLPVEFNDTVPAEVEILVPPLPMFPDPDTRFNVPLVVNAPLL